MSRKIYSTILSSVLTVSMLSNSITYGTVENREDYEDHSDTSSCNELISYGEAVDDQYIVVTNDELSDDIESKQLMTETMDTDHEMYVVNMSEEEAMNIINDDNIVAVEEDFIVSANSIDRNNTKSDIKKRLEKEKNFLKTKITKKPELPKMPSFFTKPELNARPELTKKPELAVRPELTNKPELTTAPELTDNTEFIDDTDILNDPELIWNPEFMENQELPEYSVNDDYEWNIQSINAEALSEKIDTQDKVKIAILDSGVDRISNVNIEDSVCLVTDEDQITPMFEDLTGHGTSIASIIAGNGKDGVLGINPDAEIYSVKILDKDNTAPVSRIIEGIYWCIDNDIDIINMSFGTNRYSAALEQAVKNAYDAGILMIGAAGNNATDVEYPAAFNEVMAVASVNPEAQISNFSNTGEELEIAAPGEKIKAAGFFGGTIVTHGTSIAVPHVVGVASLLWEKDTSKSSEFIRQLIDYSAKNIENTDDCGLIDADYALSIYNDFEEIFGNGTTAEDDIAIPENTEEADKFESISDDENYVEGLWNKSDHELSVANGITNLQLTSDEVKVIKLGAVYPDTVDALKKATPHPQWHGYYYNACNYIGCYQLVQRIAKGAGNIDCYTDGNNPIPGLSNSDYLAIKNCFGRNSETFCGKSYASIINDNCKLQYKYSLNSEADKKRASRYRRCFIYGLSMHILADTFAHSAYTVKGEKINHEGGSGKVGKADDRSYLESRFECVKRGVGKALQNLQNNTAYGYLDFATACEREYYRDEDHTFYIRHLLYYAEKNGVESGTYLHRVLSYVDLYTNRGNNYTA